MTRSRPAPPIRLEGAHHGALEAARDRLIVVGFVFAVAFCAVAGRLIDVTALRSAAETRAAAPTTSTIARADIVDRNGVLLATSLPTASLYADPSEVLDPGETVDRLVEVLPDLDRVGLLAKLTEDSRFVWIRRNLTPAEHHAVNRLGLPGIGFRTEERRVYPQGTAAAHVLGFADVDGRGLAGVERAFDHTLAAGEPARLSIDVRVQHVLRSELTAAMRAFHGVGAAGLVLDVESGEVVAMVSLPDFDPNAPARSARASRFNRVTQGVYEMGSTFKLLTAAMALDSGTTTLDGGYDASEPIRVARYRIRDFKAENRWLSVPEILVHSSNIGAAHMALDIGGPRQRRYLDAFGLLTAPPVELMEVGSPMAPKGRHWRDINTMTIGFGHGIAVSPLQLASAVATVANGGVYRPATVISRSQAPEGRRVVTEETSRQIRALMRLVVLRGTGRKADVAGLRLGGKTGTAEKTKGGRYRKDSRLASFVGVFPIDRPRYAILAMVDEPKGNASTLNFATGGWVAAPVVGQVAARIAPILGIAPAAVDITTAETKQSPRMDRKAPIFVAMQRAFDDVRGRRLATE